MSDIEVYMRFKNKRRVKMLKHFKSLKEEVAV